MKTENGLNNIKIEFPLPGNFTTDVDIIMSYLCDINQLNNVVCMLMLTLTHKIFDFI